MPKSRQQNQRQPNRTLHIYCEGEKTEPNYLQGYIDWRFPGERSKVVIKIEAAKKNTPLQLVEEAIAASKSDKTLAGDEFWVVYDREAGDKYPDKLHEQARKLAQKHGIHIALSNVCFEIWLLLHFRDNTKPYRNCAELVSSREFKDSMREARVDNYDKGNHKLFERLRPRIDDARVRAGKMNQATRAAAAAATCQPHQLNPYTDLPLLLAAMDAFQAKP